MSGVTLVLVPRDTGVGVQSGNRFYEAVEVRDANGYPETLVHVDLFYNSADNLIYNKLSRGETVIAMLSIKEEDS